jgi:hypothetical protein
MGLVFVIFLVMRIMKLWLSRIVSKPPTLTNVGLIYVYINPGIWVIAQIDILAGN